MTVGLPAPARLRLTLVAPDAGKAAMTEWAQWHAGLLGRCDRAAGGARIFCVDPRSPHPHDVEVKASMRVALVRDAPLALSASAADLMIEAPGRRVLPDLAGA